MSYRLVLDERAFRTLVTGEVASNGAFLINGGGRLVEEKAVDPIHRLLMMPRRLNSSVLPKINRRIGRSWPRCRRSPSPVWTVFRSFSLRRDSA
jgi:hypothetical protein